MIQLSPARRERGTLAAPTYAAYAALQAEEERVTVASQHLRASVEEFRTRKEAAKAACLAAQEATEATWAEVPLSELRPGAPERPAPASFPPPPPHTWYAEAIARAGLRYRRTRPRVTTT